MRMFAEDEIKLILKSRMYGLLKVKIETAAFK